MVSWISIEGVVLTQQLFDCATLSGANGDLIVELLIGTRAGLIEPICTDA